MPSITVKETVSAFSANAIVMSGILLTAFKHDLLIFQQQTVCVTVDSHTTTIESSSNLGELTF